MGVPPDEKVKLSEVGVPCGGCQWMGENPPLEDGVCRICGRTTDEIIRQHGKVELSDQEKEDRKHAASVHMCGGDIVYV